MKLGKASSCLASLLLQLTVGAELGFAGPIEWRGFFSTGAAVTDANVPYQGDITRKARVTDETFLGLNLSKELNSEWRIAGQILGRAGQADSTAKVDWAFVTYQPKAEYEVILGKQKVPIWMISEYIDVGRNYPWVEPPEEVYSIFPLKAFAGASAAYHLKLGESTLTFEPYGGDVIYETAPNSPTADSKRRGNNMFGATVTWELGSSLLRAAYNQAEWEFNFGAERNFGTRRMQIYSMGLKSEFEGFLIMAEYAGLIDLDEDHYLGVSRQLANDAAGAPIDQQASMIARSNLLQNRIGGNKGYYATFGKEFLEDFLVHLTYASVRRPFQPRISRDQSSAALGLNYDINTDSVLKLEVKHIMLPSDSQGLFTTKPNRDEAMVYRFGYSMIF